MTNDLRAQARELLLCRDAGDARTTGAQGPVGDGHKTRGDPLARLALVPRTLQARGLDASPPMRRPEALHNAIIPWQAEAKSQ